MEAKQHATKKPMGQWKNSEGTSENTLRQMKMEIQPSKIYRVQLKQFYEEKSQTA